MAIRKGLAPPIGSLTQMGTIRLGKRSEARAPRIKDFVPLADLNDIVFGGWDIFEEDCYAAACTAGVLERSLLDSIRPELAPGESIQLRDGGDIALLSIGGMLPIAADATELLESRNIDVRLVSVPWLAPLDEDAILRAAADVGLIVTLEEHSICAPPPLPASCPDGGSTSRRSCRRCTTRRSRRSCRPRSAGAPCDR